MRETYKGRRLYARSNRTSQAGRRIEYGVNEQLVGFTWARAGRPLSDQYAAEIATMRAWVDAADERRMTEPDAYAPYWYEGATA